MSCNFTAYYSKIHDWRKQLDETHQIVERLRCGRSLSSICQSVLSYASRFGATNLLAGSMPPLQASKRDQLAHVLLAAWPEEWASRYFSNGYLLHDPAIRLVRYGIAPFLWSEMSTQTRIDAAGHRILAEAADFQLRNGLTISFETLEGDSIGLSLAGARLDLDTGHRRSLHLVSACALGQAIALAAGSGTVQPAAKLSIRQRDVLSWAAEGLTVDEIAQRLSISRNTADTHLRAARLRLGARTTVQAVAEGLRRGLIS